VTTYLLFVPEDLYEHYLQPGSEFNGDFAPGRFANFILLKDNRVWPDMRPRIYHQYTRRFLYTQSPGIHPLWFDVGLATLVEMTEFRVSTARVGIPPYDSYYWMPLDTLLRLDRSSPEYTIFTTNRVHFESWALVHRGLIGEPEFGKQMFAYLRALDELKPIDEAVPESFGMNIDQLDRSLDKYAAKYLPVVTVNLEPAPPVPQKAGNKMSELEMLELLADAMITSGSNPQHLRELVDAAYRLAPGSPTADVLRMRLAVRDRDDAALERLLQEIEPRMVDPKVARGVGLALFERVRADEDLKVMPAATREAFATRAFELLRDSVARRTDDVEAVWAYAMLAARQRRDLSASMLALYRVQRQLPDNADLAMAAALLHEARGETQDMIAALGETYRFSSSVDQRRWAKRRLEAAQATAGN
jgi:hypothetical protein